MKTMSTPAMAKSRNREKSSKRCSVCLKEFTRLEALKGHLNAHKNEKPFACSICGVRFTRANERRTHEKEQHNTQGTRFICSGLTANSLSKGCGKAFARKAQLNRHLRGPRASQCRIIETTQQGLQLQATTDPEQDLLDESTFTASTRPCSPQFTVFASNSERRSPFQYSSTTFATFSPRSHPSLDDYDFVDHFQLTYMIATEVQVTVANFLQISQGFRTSALQQALTSLHGKLIREAYDLMHHSDLIALRLCVNALFALDAARRDYYALSFHANAAHRLHSLFEQYGNHSQRQRTSNKGGIGMWSFGGRHYLPMTQVKWLAEQPHLLASGDVAIDANSTLGCDLNWFRLEFFM